MTVTANETLTDVTAVSLTFDTARLGKALDRLSKVKASARSHPILRAVLLTGNADGTTLSAFDMETSLTFRVGNEPAHLCVAVDAAKLRDVVKRLGKRKITSATITVDGPHIRVAHGKGEVSLLTLPVEDYPAIPVVRPDFTLTMLTDTLAGTVKRVAVAACRDATLPAFTGIRMECVDGDVTLAATDRYRLTHALVQGVGDGTWNSVIPRAALVHILSCVDEDSVTVTASCDGNGQPEWIGITAGDLTATMRVIDGEFPRYRSLIPSGFQAEVRVPNRDAREAVSAVAAAAERNAPVVLSWDKTAGDTLTVSSHEGDEMSATERVSAGFTDSDMTIGCNPTYLDDALSVLGDRVRISAVRKDKPMVLRTVGDDTFTYLLMPVRLEA